MKALLKVLTTSLVLMMMGYSIQAQAVGTPGGVGTTTRCQRGKVVIVASAASLAHPGVWCSA